VQGFGNREACRGLATERLAGVWEQRCRDGLNKKYVEKIVVQLTVVVLFMCVVPYSLVTYV
jgi:hypothetical protein